MFSSVVLEGTNIESSWKSEKSTKDSDCQTGAIEMKHSESQAIERTSSEVQTVNPADQELKLASYDEKSLDTFLKRITPALLKELDKNLRSNAFEGYELINDDSPNLITKIHSLTSSTIPKEFGCTGVSWNSMGTVVGVSYGSRQHENWCDHHGKICFWGLNRKDFTPNKPNKTFDHSSCITCIKFHPQQPTTVVAGTFIGEILLLNVSGETDFLTSSTETGSKGHHDTVTDIIWFETENNKYLLATCGLDGKILFWEKTTQNSELKLTKAFIILAGNLPRELRIRSNRQASEVGLSALSFNAEDKSLFVISSEGGGIFQCSTESQFPSTADLNFIMDIKNPIALWYKPHKGHVNGVVSSPFSRNIFASYGSDGEIRIWNYNQANAPITTIYSENTPIKVAWSPTKALLVAVVTSKGFLNLYDLRSSANVLIVSTNLAEEGCDGCVLEFCSKNPKYLATGTEDASVQIWALNEKLLLPAANEFDCLLKMGKIS